MVYLESLLKKNTLLFQEKCSYSTKIKERGKYQKKLFKLASNLMGNNSNVNLQQFTEKNTITKNKIISDSQT